MNTPVALIIFNRPDLTRRVFAEIARAKPPVLFVIADGPRENTPEDNRKCAEARAVIERVDWDCDVRTHFSTVNIGCGRRPASGIGWVFEQVEAAIILEDDVIPDPSFFPFCEELLHRYRDDERIMMVGGLNMAPSDPTGDYSYVFRRNPPCNGAWATWRRAWRHFDFDMKLWAELRHTSWLLDILGDERSARHWADLFETAYQDKGVRHYWDYQWVFSCWTQNGFAAVSRVNLVRNIGFGEDATHTKSTGDPRANLETVPATFPLRHPPYVIRERDVELLIDEKTIFTTPRKRSLYRKIRRRLSRAIPGINRELRVQS